MKDKNKGFNLGYFYFDYQSRNLIIQSVWMMELWIELLSEYHDPSKDEFPPELTNESFRVLEKHVIKKWEDELKKMHKEMLLNPELEGFHPCFVDDPIKEGALGSLVLAAGYVGDRTAPFYEEDFEKKRNAFFIQSRCFYEMSLCYKYFFELQHVVEEEFGIEVGDVFRDLEEIRGSMWYATGALFSHWSIEDKREWSRKKGGSVSTRLPGILLAVKKILQEGNRTSYSAERLWNFFEEEHMGKKKAITVNAFKIYFKYKDLDSLEGRIVQISPNGENKSIGRSAFTGYVKKAKQSLK